MIKFLYVSFFIALFLATTGAIYVLNLKYENIFRFDFRENQPDKSIEDLILGDVNNQKEKQDTVLAERPPTDKELVLNSDSGQLLTSKDSLNHLIRLYESLLDSVNYFESRLSRYADSLKQDRKMIAGLESKLETNKTAEYEEWMKNTVRIYESMDPKQVARILQNYSDEVARDILYSLKKKKAAQVLSELNTTTASKLTRMN